jgi:hypothetical protein
MRMKSFGQNSVGNVLLHIIKWVGIGSLAVGLLLALLWIGFKLFLHGPLYFVWTPTFKEVPTDRSPLIDGLVSYQSVDEVTAILKQRGYTWTLKRDTFSLFEPYAPFLEFADLTVTEFLHLGHGGALKLHFSNNRLVSALFCPMDLPGYLEQLAKHEGMVLAVPQGQGLEATRSATTIPPYTAVRTRGDFGAFGPPGVGWSDTRLTWEWEVYQAKYDY